MIYPDLTMEIPERLGRVHFVGIGGSGMSGIARMMHAAGVPVTGSDRSANYSTAALEELYSAGRADAVLVIYAPGLRTHYEQVADAVRRSAVLAPLTAEQADALACGVWGRKVPHSHVLQDGDRVELYRALLVDPKVARRERFVGQGTKSAGLFAKRRAGAKAGY